MNINISAKEFEKLSKYKDLQIEVERIWQLKTSIIPIVVGAIELVKKGTAKHLEKIPGTQSLEEIQKIVLTSTAQQKQQKKIVQNENPKTKKKQQKHKNISLPVASGFG